MSYLSEQNLLSYREQYRGKNTSRIFQESLNANVTIFLSHSHEDNNLVEGLILYLAQFGLNIYVDWKDSAMPKETNKTTASTIKTKIKDLDMFWVLATKNAINSKWVPWEIGIADVLKGGNVFIIPVSDANGKFHGNEYLQLYERIELANSGVLASFQPNKYQGHTITEILKRRGPIFG
ncbi:toll/interleukin-1 receptor domain-containing protein [Leptospira sarikeiensis]|uniref:TIR domain-containing protein n=1 Tax=Leptospira sarikeiensis TaxID=2484943 RepID=A0A4R9K8L1_9LEPT|nr:toll/interleukin-1 receptor domain-containing protein [Leptospira sarikeiensis]TGL62027.1 TIR domain-containing protein [Leptospira sarikeiensis]